MRKFTLFLMSLFLSVGAMAQTLVEYKIVTSGDGITGVLSRTDTGSSSSWKDLFTYTTTDANPALLKLQVTRPSATNFRFDMTTYNGGVVIATGGNTNPTTYTLSVPEPYRIASYSFSIVASNSANTITPVNGTGHVVTTSKTETKVFSVTDINLASAAFTLEGTNNNQNVTNFVVKVYNNLENKYITLQCVNGEKYLTSTIGTTSDCRRLVMNANEKDVFYYTGNALLSYTEGKYMKVSAKGQRYEMYWDEVGVETPVAIGIQANGDGVYSVTLGNKNEFVNNNNTGYRYLHGTNGYTDSGTSASLPTDNGYKWYVEEATSLPVTISAAGWATFYAPVAVEVADGVTAYAVTINGNWATLTAIEGGVIPANTGVVLQGEVNTTYDFAVTNTTVTVDSDLTGSVAATYITDDACVLTADNTAEAGVCFGKATKNQQSNTSWLNNSHKAYLPMPENAEGIKSYSFRFGEGTTGVENVEVENEVKVIYDLTGRRVEAITAPGIYIVNGVKRVVR